MSANEEDTDRFTPPCRGSDHIWLCKGGWPEPKDLCRCGKVAYSEAMHGEEVTRVVAFPPKEAKP